MKIIANSRLNVAGDQLKVFHKIFLLFSPTARANDQNKTEKQRKVFKAQTPKKTIAWCAMETVGKREHKVSGRMVPQLGFGFVLRGIRIAQLQLWRVIRRIVYLRHRRKCCLRNIRHPETFQKYEASRIWLIMHAESCSCSHRHVWVSAGS